MQQFLKTIKLGRWYYLQDGGLDDIKFIGYIESVDVEQPGQSKQNYGYSIEIELWTDKRKAIREIGKRRAEIVTLLKLEECEHQVNPMQELTYRRITGAKK